MGIFVNKIRHILLRKSITADEPGFSVVELLIALTLMAFLATSLLTIITTGSGAFQRALDEKAAQGEARIAVSYITVKLRQNSSRERISLIPSDSVTNARNVLQIDKGGAGRGENYFIYFEEGAGGGAGRLVEKNAASPRVDDPAGAIKIADIADFDISYANEEQTVINIHVCCDTPSGRITRDVSVTLRA